METKATKKQIENITKTGKVWAKNGHNRVYPKGLQMLWESQNPEGVIRYSANRIKYAFYLDADSNMIVHEDHDEHMSILVALDL